MKIVLTSIIFIFTGCFNFNIAIDNSQSQIENRQTSTQNISYDKNGRETATITNLVFHKKNNKQFSLQQKKEIKKLENRYLDLILEFETLTNQGL